MSLPSSQEMSSMLDELVETARSYSDTPDPASFMSRVQIIEKAKKLTRSLIAPEMTPNYHGLNVRLPMSLLFSLTNHVVHPLWMAELCAIRTFMKLKILEATPMEGAVTFQDLSKATGCKNRCWNAWVECWRQGLTALISDEVATGFLDQTSSEGGDFKHTKFSKSYVPYPGPGQLFLAMYDEWFENMHNFHEYLAARGQLSQAQEPDDPLRNPYTWTHKQDGNPVWAIMAQDPEKIKTFQLGLAGIDIAVPVVGHFDFDLLKNTAAEEDAGRTELVDVGGGHGTCLQQILSRYPSLHSHRCMLQERPDVIGMAKARGELPTDVQLVEHDFFTDNPIKGAKAYFMRMILHDYSDRACIDILSHIAASMAPDSRVLVCDMVLPNRVSELDFPAAVMDQAVMTMGGKERTEAMFRSVFEKAGLQNRDQNSIMPCQSIQVLH